MDDRYPWGLFQTMERWGFTEVDKMVKCPAGSRELNDHGRETDFGISASEYHIIKKLIQEGRQGGTERYPSCAEDGIDSFSLVTPLTR